MKSRFKVVNGGFVTVLGSFPVQFGLLLAMIATVPTSSDADLI